MFILISYKENTFLNETACSSINILRDSFHGVEILVILRDIISQSSLFL